MSGRGQTHKTLVDARDNTQPSCCSSSSSSMSLTMSRWVREREGGEEAELFFKGGGG